MVKVSSLRSSVLKSMSHWKISASRTTSSGRSPAARAAFQRLELMLKRRETSWWSYWTCSTAAVQASESASQRTTRVSSPSESMG